MDSSMAYLSPALMQQCTPSQWAASLAQEGTTAAPLI
jgi:hypothetical protein